MSNVVEFKSRKKDIYVALIFNEQDGELYSLFSKDLEKLKLETKREELYFIGTYKEYEDFMNNFNRFLKEKARSVGELNEDRKIY